ncbi:hypothetical protein DEO72_LG7g372 [Vigna unguiculata]|uniref:Uncharacterized protein n=1 Tax=Vigna unguiculata TaxID=3917 RepID=A0A4D6MCE3_VIGUN|nr:hypothetical protein DEO72_LG7g372 [Vigna unguiculata]
MVNFTLMITAELENLTNLQPQGGCDDPNFPYLFKLKCGRCGELSQKETCVVLNDTVPLPVGKATTHLIQKGKLQQQQPDIDHNPKLWETNFRVTKIRNLGYKSKKKGTRTQKPVFAVVVAVGIVRESEFDGGSVFSLHCVLSLLHSLRVPGQQRGGCHGGGETRSDEWAALPSFVFLASVLGGGEMG